MTERNTTLRNGPYIGRSLPRFEDLRLVRGAGRYTDDIVVPGQACATFLRSPHAHARILRIDTSAARARPGVLAVLTGADYVADGLLGAAQGPVPADAIDVKHKAFESTKHHILDEPQFPLAVERVRYPGEAVAVIVAEDLFTARDAAELIAVEYEVLQASTDVHQAIGAQAIWPAAPDNIADEQQPHQPTFASMSSISVRMKSSGSSCGSTGISSTSDTE